MAEVCGMIGNSYTKDEFLARTGWSDKEFRAAKRRGLRVVKSGRRVFIRGSDFDAYLDKLADEQTTD